MERELASRYGLFEVLVSEAPNRGVEDVRENLGVVASAYLNRHLCDDSLLAIGGGRQMWCVVRNLTPRQVRTTITGLGVQQNDPQVLHAHANTLITLMWLLYSPRTKAQLVGEDLDEIWRVDLPASDYPKYFVIGSCDGFDAQCHLARLLGEEISQSLLKRNVSGDFLYQFFDEDGHLTPTPPLEQKSILSAELLRRLSQRGDARVILVAGGEEKLDIIKFVLKAGLCNVLVTDLATAHTLAEADPPDLPFMEISSARLRGVEGGFGGR